MIPSFVIGTWLPGEGTYFGLAQDGKMNPRTGLPNLLQLAVAPHPFLIVYG